MLTKEEIDRLNLTVMVRHLFYEAYNTSKVFRELLISKEFERAVLMIKDMARKAVADHALVANAENADITAIMVKLIPGL
jgi:hypothetical protein